MTMWHHVHLGSFAARGAGLVMTEVISVSPEGRISPQDLGLWVSPHRPRRQFKCLKHRITHSKWATIFRTMVTSSP